MAEPTRRSFLNHSTALAAGAVVLPHVAATAYAANEKVRVACIGVRGQGNHLLKTFVDQPDVVVTHICDVDESVRATRGKETETKTGKAPKLVVDYRTILDDKTIDALVIGTPDHWHALPTVHGCQAGKDVYVEKPDGHNVVEGKTMVAAARKHDRIVQMGTQARSSPGHQEGVEYVKSGAIGKAIFGKAWETAKQKPIPREKDSEVPKGVDYNLWLGPAAERPFNVRRFHSSWRWFFDFGCGDLGNDGVHRLDYARWAMGLGYPTAVTASGGKFYFDDAQEWPDTQIVTYEYPGQILTYEMRLWSQPKLHDLTEAAAVYGDKGWVLFHNNGYKAFDGANKLVKEKSNDSPLPLHVRNFLDAVKSRKRETLNQEIASGHVSSVLCHLGNTAWRTGLKLHFDPKTETCAEKEANKYMSREYRKGFELPSIR